MYVNAKNLFLVLKCFKQIKIKTQLSVIIYKSRQYNQTQSQLYFSNTCFTCVHIGWTFTPPCMTVLRVF